jgi:hypothetical protein
MNTPQHQDCMRTLNGPALAQLLVFQRRKNAPQVDIDTEEGMAVLKAFVRERLGGEFTNHLPLSASGQLFNRGGSN